MTADSGKVAEVENIYADLNDAFTILTTIDSGLFTSFRGKDRAAWEHLYHEKRKAFSERLATLPDHGFSDNDTEALVVMRTQFAAFSETISAPFNPGGKCQDASARTRIRTRQIRTRRCARLCWSALRRMRTTSALKVERSIARRRWICSTKSKSRNGARLRFWRSRLCGIDQRQQRTGESLSPHDGDGCCRRRKTWLRD